jgi:hypothetical protein
MRNAQANGAETREFAGECKNFQQKIEVTPNGDKHTRESGKAKHPLDSASPVSDAFSREIRLRP